MVSASANDEETGYRLIGENDLRIRGGKTVQETTPRPDRIKPSGSFQAGPHRVYPNVGESVRIRFGRWLNSVLFHQTFLFGSGSEP